MALQMGDDVGRHVAAIERIPATLGDRAQRVRKKRLASGAGQRCVTVDQHRRASIGVPAKQLRFIARVQRGARCDGATVVG
ncbi:hypothetical protein LMG27177_02236 [Paraburkholderia fynbosensis]|uniref:Uncharacterized protein n=1 Tax=Paraburkholderia fynbosensis TaxID=1200993 RepID=A0A6J5FYI3_9BURK|nr:hypothetical protein [Paraburkholderia fynbosensis]CAB3787524.1 hypothetical protein LMG27177_02236 [Paraburkholderia fynbosensis]